MLETEGRDALDGEVIDALWEAWLTIRFRY